MPDDKKIDALWRTYSEQAIHPGAPNIQRSECRKAFYGGAVSLYSSIMTMLEPGAEPTDNDLKMMDDLQAELEQFAAEAAAGRV